MARPSPPPLNGPAIRRIMTNQPWNKKDNCVPPVRRLNLGKGQETHRELSQLYRIYRYVHHKDT